MGAPIEAEVIFGRLDHIHKVGHITQHQSRCQRILSNLGYFTHMSPAQSRAGRAWLGWSQRTLAEKARVALGTINEFEAGRRTPTPNNLLAIRQALERGGIVLLYDQNGAAAGIARQDAEIGLSSIGPLSD
jgi:DNA-binding XRE family transcriptional regulator